MMTQASPLPPDAPNGFTRFVRRITMVLASASFFGLNGAHIMGYTVNPVPWEFNALLFAAMIAPSEAIQSILSRLGGKK